MESSTLLPKSHRNHIFPKRWSHEPCKNIEVNKCDTCRPGSVLQTSPGPMGKRVLTGREPVNPPGISPSSQTDLASGTVAPTPCTTNQLRTYRPISIIVTMAVRWGSFSPTAGTPADEISRPPVHSPGGLA